jgi:hypothetical protein
MAIHSSEMMVPIYETTQCHGPEDYDRQKTNTLLLTLVYIVPSHMTPLSSTNKTASAFKTYFAISIVFIF